MAFISHHPLTRVHIKQGFSIFVLTAITLLTACGGGSPDSGDTPVNDDNTENRGPNNDTGNTSGNLRVQRYMIDMDNNDVEDASIDYSYDTDGHLIQWQYSYTGDGAEDKYNPVYESRLPDFASDTTSPYGEELIWNDQGVLTGSIFSDANYRWVHRYSYIDGKLSRDDSEVYNSAGALLTTQYELYRYSGERLSQVDTFDAANDTLTSSATLTYNASGQLVAHVNGDSTMRYRWNEDGSLSSIEETDTLEGSEGPILIHSFLQRINYADGHMAGRFNSNQINNKNSTEIFSYEGERISSVTFDLDSDGSIEATETVIWEDGNCISSEAAGTLYDVLYAAMSNLDEECE